MAGRGDGATRLAGLLIVTVIFAVMQPVLLVGLPLAVLLAAYGPRDVRAGLVIAGVAVFALLGDRADLWWFERAWPLILGGCFVWVVGLRRSWSFSAQALAALGLAVAVTAGIVGLNPRIWLEIDAAMAAQATAAARTAASLLGEPASTSVQELVSEAADLQALLFPALLALSSLAALGIAVWVRGWLAGERSVAVGPLRGFRFNDHLVWIWLAGLVLLLAPLGDLGARVGGNTVFFMGLLYVLRGLAIGLAIVGNIPIALGVLGGVVVLVLSPLLALLLILALLVGLGDTWLDLRARLASRDRST